MDIVKKILNHDGILLFLLVFALLVGYLTKKKANIVIGGSLMSAAILFSYLAFRNFFLVAEGGRSVFGKLVADLFRQLFSGSRGSDLRQTIEGDSLYLGVMFTLVAAVAMLMTVKSIAYFTKKEEKPKPKSGKGADSGG
ncbi:MAG TPA: hypothetical protein PKV71_05525 [Calditrichia bacterium]|nr:hypothetical protein [Calditrichia bacterium]HQV31313.1 hypothetical protein [Calditrichia bacterium]